MNHCLLDTGCTCLTGYDLRPPEWRQGTCRPTSDAMRMYLLEALGAISCQPTLSNQAIPNQGPCGVQQGYNCLGMNPASRKPCDQPSTPHKLSLYVHSHNLLPEHGHAKHADMYQAHPKRKQAACW